MKVCCGVCDRGLSGGTFPPGTEKSGHDEAPSKGCGFREAETAARPRWERCASGSGGMGPLPGAGPDWVWQRRTSRKADAIGRDCPREWT